MMKRFGNIKFRITVWYSVFILLLIGIVLFLFCFFSAQTIKSKVTSNIKAEVMEASHLLARQHRSADYEAAVNDEDFCKVSVYDIQGQFLAGKHLHGFEDITFEDDTVRRVSVGGIDYLIYDYFKEIKNAGGVWIRGAAVVDFTQSYNNTLFRFVLLLLPLLLLAVLFGGFLIIKIAFMPINKIIDTANTISVQNDISKRIPIKENAPKDELYMMTVTLNNMLDKIQKQLEREQQITLDISHELRTPISVILSYSEYLNELAEGDKEKELAANIMEQTKKVTRLISTLLMLSRIENGKQPINTETVNISEIMEAVTESLADKATQKQITVETEIEDNITLLGDEALLMSAFVNLADNAVKYSRTGGMIKIRVYRMNNQTEISVEDNGIGISEDDIGKIWDSFYRADESRHNYTEGYGLGLSLVKSIIELHCGQIHVSSQLGKGTIFKIIFKN